MPPLSPDTSKVFSFKIVAALATLLVLVGVGIVVYKTQYHPANVILQQDTQATTTASGEDQYSQNVDNKVYASTTQQAVYNSAVPDSLVMIYTTQASTTLSMNRVWPSYKIWKKVGSGAPEFIAAVGTVGEYPASFTLSPDRHVLAVNLENSLLFIDIASRASRTLFTTGRGITGVAFAPDSKSVLVAEGSTFSRTDSNYALFVVDLASGQQKNLYRGNGGDIGPLAWRPDGVLVFNFISYKDCGGPMSYLNPASGVVKTLPGDDEYVPGGQYVLSPTQTMPSPYGDGMCSSGMLPTIMSVVDPVSGQVYGSIGVPGQLFTFIALSPDNASVLFKATKGATTSNLGVDTYYLQQIEPGATPVAVADPNTVLMGWKSDAQEVKLPAEGQNPYGFYVKGALLLKVSDQSPSLLAQYFK